MTAIGLALGTAGVLVALRLVRTMLVDVGTVDPVAYAGGLILLAAVSAIACYIPARRATHVQPVVALRCD